MVRGIAPSTGLGQGALVRLRDGGVVQPVERHGGRRALRACGVLQRAGAAAAAGQQVKLQSSWGSCAVAGRRVRPCVGVNELPRDGLQGLAASQAAGRQLLVGHGLCAGQVTAMVAQQTAGVD